MSVLPNQTNINLDSYFFIKVDSQQINTSSITVTGGVTATNVYAGNVLASNTSVSSITASTATVTGDLNALNLTATDTITSYFTNTQYITSYNGANIHNLLLADQIQGSNLVQFPLATLSSISTTSITLDGNTLDTAGTGIGASLLLNGQPVATTSTLASSILTWSYYPALSNVDMNGKSLQSASVVQGDTANFYNMNAANQITFANNLYGEAGNLNSLNVSTISTGILKAYNANVGQTLTAKQADVTTINATDITTATLTTTTGGSVSADSGTYKDLTVTNQTNLNGLAVTGAATFSSSTRPDFQKGINVSGANNFNNGSLDNVPNINTQGTTNMTIASANGMDLTAPTRIQLVCDGGNDIGSYKPVNIIGKNGNRGQVNITAEPGYINVGSQIQGEVNITANGGGGLTAYATGGNINITATTGSSPILGTLSFSAIKIAAASVLSYAGFASPIVGVPGYNYIQGTLGVNLVAGAVSVIPNVPGTVYLYGATGIPQQTGGVRCQNGIGVDFIVPYPTGFIGPEKDLFISGNPAGNKVTLSNVRTLQSDGGVALGFNSMATSNLQTSNIVMFGNGTNNGNILGLSGLEQLTNFSNVSSLNVNAGQGNFFLLVPKQISTQSLYLSSINGLPFSAIIAPTIPSTFSELFTSSFNAQTISTGTLYAYSLNGVSSIDGFSLAQLVSSVSPQAPAPSTFLQLYTSSFVANTIQTSNLSTVSMQAQGITGVSTINGFTIAQFVSSVAPQAPAPSTFNQLFTSSFVANTITGGNSVGLKLLGQGVSIQPNNDYSINLTTTGVGLTTLVTPVQFQIFSPSTVVYGDLRYTTLFGQPYNPLQVNTSSIVASNISVVNEQVSGTLTVGGVAVIPQQSTFSNLFVSSLNANTISSTALITSNVTLSTINGYNLNQIINQPVISTFCNIYVSDGAILNITSFNLSNAAALFTSSINGYNVDQFLSSSGQYPQGSTFNILFASSFQANAISTRLLTVSTINGFNISQLANPTLSTVSTFAQLFTSSLVANGIQTSNLLASNVQSQLVSTIGVNAVTLNGVSSISGYSIAQLVSSVAPQPPIPSTVNQFYTSSLAANVITNYQTQGVNVLAPGYINVHAGTGVNIIGDQCNVTVTSSNIIENALYNYTNNTGNNWTVTAGCNIAMNSSNTLIIYNTNTAPAVAPNDMYIIGQGTTTLAGQNTLNLTSQTNLVATGSNNVLITSSNGTSLQCVNSNISVRGNSVTIESIGSNIDITASQSVLGYAGTKFQFNTPSTILSGDLNVQTINGQIPVFGGGGGSVTSTFQQLFTSSLGATLNYLSLTANRSITQNSVSTITNATGAWFSGDITATTFNGLPLPTGGGGTTTSSFQNLYTNTLSNNPDYGNDLNINATVAIHMGNSSGLTTLSIGDSFDVQGVTGATNIYSASFNTLNDNISLTARSNITFTSPSTLTSATGAWFSGDITATTFNGLPLPTGGGGTTTSSFQNLYTNTLSNNPDYGNDLNINATVAIHMGNSGGLTTLSIGDSFDVQGTTGATNIYSASFTTFNDNISLTARSNITFTSPSTLTSNIYVADIFNNPSVGTDINLTAAQTLGESAVSITRNASGTIVDDTVGGYTLNAGPALATQLIATSNITLAPSNSAFITANNGITLSTITSINLNCLVPASNIVVSPVQFATGQVFPQPGSGRYQFLTNNSATIPWDYVLLTDSDANVYWNAPWDAAQTLNFPITATLGSGGYYDLKITYPTGDVSEYLVQYQLDGTLLYGIVTPTTADFTWGQGASGTVPPSGQININATETNIVGLSSINLSSPSLLWNGAPISGGGSWVGTASSDLNMNGYNITSPVTVGTPHALVISNVYGTIDFNYDNGIQLTSIYGINGTFSGGYGFNFKNSGTGGVTCVLSSAEDGNDADIDIRAGYNINLTPNNGGVLSGNGDLNMNSYKIYGCNTGNMLGNYQPFKFVYEPPTAAGQSAEFAIQAHPQDAGVVFNLRYGVDLAGGYGYLLCEWPGYIVVPMKIYGQDIALEGGETVHINTPNAIYNNTGGGFYVSSATTSITAGTTTLLLNSTVFDLNINNGIGDGAEFAVGSNDLTAYVGYNQFNLSKDYGFSAVANVGTVYFETAAGDIGFNSSSNININSASNINMNSPSVNRPLYPGTSIPQPVIQLGNGAGSAGASGMVTITMPYTYNNYDYKVTITTQESEGITPGTYFPIYTIQHTSGNSFDVYWTGASPDFVNFFMWVAYGFYTA